MGKRDKKQSECDVTKSLKVTMGWNVAIFMGKMDVQYMSMNVTMGQNVTQLGWPKMCG